MMSRYLIVNKLTSVFHASVLNFFIAELRRPQGAEGAPRGAPYRGIECSLRAFASMRAVINFVMRAASTLEFTKGEQRALRKFFASCNLSLLKCCFAPSNLADTFKTGQRAQS